MFEAPTYLERRSQLLESVTTGYILFLGHRESPKNYTGNPYVFRQDSSFLYFTGLDIPQLALLIDAEEGTETLYGPVFSLDDEIWMGPQPSLIELCERSGISNSEPIANLSEKLDAIQQEGRPLHYLPPFRGESILFLQRALLKDEKDIRNGASEDLIRAVVAQQEIKSEREIEEMDRAVRTTGRMHRAAMQSARKGMLEAELAGLVEGLAVAGGGDLAYPVILTVHGEVLHNHHHHNRLEAGQLVLGDFGAETAHHYAGDITRTFPVSPTFSPRQKDIYQIVLDAQLGAIEALRPGVPYRDVHLKACRILADGLIQLGLMTGKAEDAVEAGAHALFFPHGLGHMIGLDVHDMEGLGEDLVGYDDEIGRSQQFGLKSLRLGKRLKEGFVLTVEPGLYFIPALIEKWEGEGLHKDFIAYDKLPDYHDFSGIRIEDNLAITSGGSRLLGEPIPKTIEEVEEMRQKNLD